MGIRVKVEVITADGCRACWSFADEESNTTESTLAETLGHAVAALGYCLIPSNESDTALAFLQGAGISGLVQMEGEVTP